MEIRKALYLVPVNIGEGPLADVLPEGNKTIIKEIKHFIVENVRTARRFLKKLDHSIDIGSLTFFELNNHTDPSLIKDFIQPLREGFPIGVMSEAGCPGVADPGSLAVRQARKEGFRIIPLVGPSSILMSLMASGFNGQGFNFHGYLPIDNKERERKIRELENMSRKTGFTQIFIETPYRNNRMMESLLSILGGETELCVACDITDPENEEIVMKKVREWKKGGFDFGKRPAVFLVYCPN